MTIISHLHKTKILTAHTEINQFWLTFFFLCSYLELYPFWNLLENSVVIGWNMQETTGCVCPSVKNHCEHYHMQGLESLDVKALSSLFQHQPYLLSPLVPSPFSHPSARMSTQRTLRIVRMPLIHGQVRVNTSIIYLRSGEVSRRIPRPDTGPFSYK